MARRAARFALEPLERRSLLSAVAAAGDASVHGTVYHDLNADGFREGHEGGLPGATVYADLDNDAAFNPGEPSAVTTETGAFALTVAPGTYTLRVAGPQPGYSTSIPATGARTATFVPHVTYQGLDFGIYTTGTILITVFHDFDGDAVPGGSFEYPLEGRTVYDDANGNDRLDPGEPSRVTGPDGVVRFENMKPGARTIRQVLPPGWTETGYLPDPAFRKILYSATTLTGALGTRQPLNKAVLAGVVYDDANANRARDAGEAGIAGRTVYLDADHDGAFDPGETTTTTDATGAYTFNAPAPGRHYVRQIVPDGWTRTTPMAHGNGGQRLVVVDVNQTKAGLDFGTIHAPPASISGRAYEDLDADGVRDPGEPPLGGTAYLEIDNSPFGGPDEPVVPLDAAGNYTLTELPPGTYQVRYAAPGGYLQTDPMRDERGSAVGHTVTVAAGQHATAPDFGAVNRLTTGTLFGQIAIDNNGDGRVTGGDVAVASNFVAYIDSNYNGVLDPGERSRRTLNNGFLFDGLAPGTYRVGVIVPEGYRQTHPWPPGGGYTVTVAAKQTISTLNFNLTPVTTPSAISGSLYADNNGNGRRDAGDSLRTGGLYLDLNNDGVRTLNEPATTADSDGTYAFTRLAAGTYTVRANLFTSETMTTPAGGAHTVTVGANDLSPGNDFGFVATSKLPRIGGVVFDDTNGDGRFSSGEPAPAGRVVWIDADDDFELDPGERTATQGVDGYVFTDVMPGTYTVRVVLPAGMRQTQPGDRAGRTVTVGVNQSHFGASFGLAVAPPDPTPPAVTGVSVRSSAWSQPMVSALAAQNLGSGGYAVPQPDGTQGRTLPWVNVDTVVVRFSEDVLVQADDLRVVGRGQGHCPSAASATTPPRPPPPGGSAGRWAPIACGWNWKGTPPLGSPTWPETAWPQPAEPRRVTTCVRSTPCPATKPATAAPTSPTSSPSAAASAPRPPRCASITSSATSTAADGSTRWTSPWRE